MPLNGNWNTINEISDRKTEQTTADKSFKLGSPDFNWKQYHNHRKKCDARFQKPEIPIPGQQQAQQTTGRNNWTVQPSPGQEFALSPEGLHFNTAEMNRNIYAS